MNVQGDSRCNREGFLSVTPVYSLVALPVSYYPASSYTDGFMLSKGNKLGVVSLPAAYTVSFDLYPTADCPTLICSIILLSASGLLSNDSSVLGGRLPEIGWDTGRGISVDYSTGATSEPTGGTRILASFSPMKEWASMVVTIDPGAKAMKVADSESAFRQTLALPEPARLTWPSAQVFASNPWNAAMPAKIRNLVIAAISSTTFPKPTPAPTAPLSAQQALTEFVLSHSAVLAYVIALALGLGSGMVLAFLRRAPCYEFNIVPLSSIDIVFSCTMAVLQVVSNVTLVADAPQSESDVALVCIVLVRLIMVSVTVSVVFRALYQISLSRFVVGACFHNATVWVAIAALALLDPSILRFFCWKHSEFAKRSGGFPTMGVFYLTLASTAASSLIMTILSAAEYLESYQGQTSLVVSSVSFVTAIITIVFRLRAEKIHNIQVYIIDSEGLIVVREDGVFENDRRIEDKELALEAQKKELARQREETASEKAVMERELREMREERAKMAQQIVKRTSKTSEEAAAAAAAAMAAAAAAEEQRAFTANVPFADENLNVLKDQLKSKGHQPLEYIPLDVLQRELDAIIAKVNAGEKYDERRLEHLLACLEINPQYKEEKEAERRAWKARIAPFCADCLSQQRNLTPPHIFSARFFDLCDEGLSVALAKRLMAKPCLWLVRMKQADILKLHEVELTNRYGSEGQGLDLVELAAIYACLPHDGGFPNDPSGRKAAYLSRLEDSLMSMLTAQDQGKLSKAKQRAACYNGAQPLYEHRQSLLERFITGTADTLESLRGSLSLSNSLSMRLSTTGGGERRSENPFQKWRDRDVEMQATASRGVLGSTKCALSKQVSVDEIPNPVRTIAAAGGSHVRNAGDSGEQSQQRRESVKAALESVIAKRHTRL